MKTSLKIALTLVGVVVLSKVVRKRKISLDHITQSQLEKVIHDISLIRQKKCQDK